MNNRTLKINSLVKRELSQIIGFELKDPHVGFVTVMAIEVSKDLRHGKAFVSIMGSDVQKKKSLQCLRKAKGFIQNELCHRLSMKFIPELQFIIDESLDHYMHIDEVLKKIHEEKKDAGGDLDNAPER